MCLRARCVYLVKYVILTEVRFGLFDGREDAEWNGGYFVMMISKILAMQDGIFFGTEPVCCLPIVVFYLVYLLYIVYYTISATGKPVSSKHH